MKFGACTSIKNIEKARTYGYDFCELPAIEIAQIREDEWEQTKNKILEKKIPILGFNSFCNASLPLVGSNVCYDDISSYFKKIVKRGNDLNIKNIGIGAPQSRTLHNDDSYNIATEQMQKNLLLFSQIANEYNIQILYEALNSSCCNFCNSTSESYETVSKLNKPNLHIVWDVYHSILEKESFSQISNYFNQIEHVHICSWNKSTLERYYLLEKDEKYISELFAFLKQMNYTGTISVEATDSSFLENGENSIKIIKNTLNNLDLQVISPCGIHDN